MFAIPSLVYRHLPFRVSAFAIFLFGVSGAATTPYMSLVGIGEFGLSDSYYSLLMFAASAVNVSASIVAGVFADRIGNVRTPLILAALCGIAGYALIYVVATPWIFAITVLGFIPLFGTINSLVFAYVRAAAATLSMRELVAVNSTIRAFISAAWVVVPGIVGLVLAGSTSMLSAYLIAGVAAVLCLVLFVFGIGREPIIERGARTEFSFGRSLHVIASWPVLSRLLALSLLTAMLNVNSTVLPLILTQKLHGTAANLGTIVGIVAFLEIFFFVFWGWVQTRISTVATMAIAASVYCAYLVLLSLSDDPSDVYPLTILSAIGGAGIIALPITYVQNLIADRAGLGSSLIAVNMFISGVIGALVFATGTAFSDYTGTAVLSAVAGLAGGLMLNLLDLRSNAMGRNEAGDLGQAGRNEDA